MSESENIEKSDLITIEEAANLVGRSEATIRILITKNKLKKHYLGSVGKVPTVSKTELLQLYPEKHYTQKTTQNDKIAILEKKLEKFEKIYQILENQLVVKDHQIQFLQEEVLKSRGFQLSLKEMQNMIELLSSQNAAKDEMYSSLQRIHETSQNRLRVLEELSFKHALNPGFSFQKNDSIPIADDPHITFSKV